MSATRHESVMFTPASPPLSAGDLVAPPEGLTATPPTSEGMAPAVIAVFGLVPDRVILLPEAIKLTGYGGTSLDRLETEGKFPQRRQIGPYRAGWLLSDLTAWMHSLPKDRPESRNPNRHTRRPSKAVAQSSDEQG